MHQDSLTSSSLGIPVDSNRPGNPLVLRFRISHHFAASSERNSGCLLVRLMDLNVLQRLRRTDRKFNPPH
jgi:hypothetical protein